MSWALAGQALAAWLLSALIWVVVSFVKERHWPHSYHQLCEVWGLCLWWPMTLTLEIALWWQYRRAAKIEEAAQRAADS